MLQNHIPNFPVQILSRFCPKFFNNVLVWNKYSFVYKPWTSRKKVVDAPEEGESAEGAWREQEKSRLQATNENMAGSRPRAVSENGVSMASNND